MVNFTEKKEKILVTSALPYVNNIPHLGNLIGAVLSADVFARYNRSRGRETIYICGADEHGTTTETKALEEGTTPQELCDKYYKIHKEIYDWFNISFDIFGRTHHPTQTELTQTIFKKLYENGYIIEDFLEQTYCEHDKRFLADRFVEGTCPHCGYEDARGDQCDNCGRMLNPKELIKPRCKICGNEPIIKKEKHLFLDLKKLQPEIEKWVEEQSKKGNWSENAIRTTKAWFKEGLEPRCITRNLEWGVPVPLKGYEDKVFYVWFDAPIGYISITKQLIGEKWIEWWKKPEEVKLYQFMGKDNIPFHTILFPGTLIGTKEAWTLVHHLSSTEYLQYEDGKFSKSRGTGVFGDDAKKTGLPADAFRYYLLINRPETSDTKFSWKDFSEKLNNELVATLGNLVNRTTVFIKRYFEGKIPGKGTTEKEDEEYWNKIREIEEKATKELEEVKIKDAIRTIMEAAREGNAYFQHTEPWKNIKEKPEKAKTALNLLAHTVRDLAIMIEPYMPTTAKKIFEQLNITEKERKWEELGKQNLEGRTINEPEHLFKKIEEKTVQELRERFKGTKEERKKEKEKEKSEGTKLKLVVAKITEVKKHPEADKLYIETIDLGQEKRQIVSGLVPYYKEEELIGKNIIIVANLKPAKLRGELSQGMLLAAEDEEGRIGLVLAPEAEPGTIITAEGTPINNEKEITIKEFLKEEIIADEEGIKLNGKKLTANNKPLITDKNIKGKIR